MIRPSSCCCASYGGSSARDYSSSDLFVRKEAGESKISTAMGDSTSILMKGEETCFMDEPDCKKIQLQQCDFNIIEGLDFEHHQVKVSTTLNEISMQARVNSLPRGSTLLSFPSKKQT